MKEVVREKLPLFGELAGAKKRGGLAEELKESKVETMEVSIASNFLMV